MTKKYLFFDLSEAAEREVNEVGYKALNLAKLLKHDYNVPDGCVVTEDIGDIVDTIIETAKSQWNMDHARGIEKYGSDIEDAMMTNDAFLRNFEKLLRECGDKVLDHHDWVARLDDEIADEFQDKDYVYARSSTDKSDTPDKTLAGAFESIPFDVKKSDKVIEDVLEHIILNLFDAQTLRRLVSQYGIKGITDLTLAVVFHEMKSAQPTISGMCRFVENSITFEMAEGLGSGFMALNSPERLPPEEEYIERHSDEVDIAYYAHIPIESIDVNKWKEKLLKNEGVYHPKGQETIATVDKEEGVGVKTRPHKVRVSEEEYESKAIDMLEICYQIYNNEAIMEDLGSSRFLLEFVVWETDAEIVQLRPLPKNE